MLPYEPSAAVRVQSLHMHGLTLDTGVDKPSAPPAQAQESRRESSEPALSPVLFSSSSRFASVGPSSRSAAAYS